MSDRLRGLVLRLVTGIFLILSESLVAAETGWDLPPLSSSYASVRPRKAMLCSVPIRGFSAQLHLTDGGAHTLPIERMTLQATWSMPSWLIDTVLFLIRWRSG